MEYRLEFYDRFYQETKVGYGKSLTDVLETWGCWLDGNHWVIKKGVGTIVGRSAPFYDKELL